MACKLLVAGWGISFPEQGLNQGPLHWERRLLATGPLGNSTICTFRNFEIYNTVLLTVLIMLYIIALELVTGRLFLWPLSHFPTFGNDKSDHFLWDFFDSTYKWDSVAFVFHWHVTQHNVLKVHPCCHKCQDSLLWLHSIPSYIYIYSTCIYPFIHCYPFIPCRWTQVLSMSWLL